MPQIIFYFLIAIVAYLLGSIPTGFLVARAKGIDIRKVGSGNIGATNAMRVLGKPAGIFVLLVDAAKGFAAVWLTKIVIQWFVNSFPGIFPEEENPVLNREVFAGIFAVLGHNYPCWLKFKGGKGIATTAGVFLALAPLALGIALVVFILTVTITRYVSLGSVTAAIALPIAVWFTRENLFLRIVTIALSALAIFKHRKNMQRLMAGTENRLGQKKSSTGDAE